MANTTTSSNTPAIAAWTLGGVVSTLAIIAWGQDYSWNLLPFDSYRWFPLLGLLAFSLMWGHYALGFMRNLFGWKMSELAHYFRITGWAVLILLCLHPGLLIYQLFRDGMGLPPGSYTSYVAPGMAWLTLLGTVSLLVFLAFELRRRYANRSWWHFIPEAGDFAMLAIFYHGLRLGGQIQGWYRTIWWVYGISLAAIIAHSYYRKYGKRSGRIVR